MHSARILTQHGPITSLITTVFWMVIVIISGCFSIVLNISLLLSEISRSYLSSLLRACLCACVWVTLLYGVYSACRLLLVWWRARERLHKAYFFFNWLPYLRDWYYIFDCGIVYRIRSVCFWASRGYGSVSQMYGSGSGSIYHQANIVQKPWFQLLCDPFIDFSSLKNYVNVPSKSINQINVDKFLLLSFWMSMTK